MTKTKDNTKYKNLLLGLLFDGVGMLSFVIPGVGEFSDVIWAPVAAWLMMKMYKGNAGKIGGAITFIEEALPGVDLIPTFTLMWLYTYVIAGDKQQKKILKEKS